MGVNIVKYGNQTLIDLTDTTAVASDVAQGKYFYGKDGVKTLGTATGGGGISSTARDLLDYILEHATYTEPDMQEYIDALYIALGGSFTYYTVTNTLSHITNSNVATQVREELSYTATLTADTDYTIGSVTITMGGVDVTSTVYSNGTITISSVTGDVVITATALPNAMELTLSANGIGSGAHLYRDEGSTTFDSLKTSGAIYYYLPDAVVSDTTYEVSITITTGINMHQYKAVYAYGADLLSGAGTASPTMYNVVTLATNGIINAQTNPISEPFTFTTNVTTSANRQLAIVFYRNHSSVISSITARRIS